MNKTRDLVSAHALGESNMGAVALDGWDIQV